MLTVAEALRAGAPPIVAILRGIAPQAAASVATVLVEAGIRLIEVPLNSPEPLGSITRMVEAVGEGAACGAGTVLSAQAVDEVVGAGGRLIVTPNTNPQVIGRAVQLGFDVLPGVASPTEAFAAVAAGATRLKLFPAASLGVGYLKALREVLPPDVGVWAVGGTDAGTLASWLDGGAEGIGVGGALFRPGMSLGEIRRGASDLVGAWRAYTATAKERMG